MTYTVLDERDRETRRREGEEEGATWRKERRGERKNEKVVKK